MQVTTDDDASISKNDAMSMFAMYVVLHEIAGALTFLHTLFLPSAPSNVENHVLSSVVIKALDFVGAKVAAAPAACEAADQTSTLPWLLTVQQAKSWCAAVSIALVQIKRAAFAQCVADVNDLSEQLVKHTPKFGHCVNDATYVKTLAKRHLLECPTKDKLGTETVELWKSLQQLQQLHSGFGLEPPLREDPTCREVVENADTAFSHAKQCVAVMAACNVIQELAGPEKYIHAKQLLDTKRGVLPKTVVTELEALAKKVEKRPCEDAASSSTAKKCKT